MKHEKKMMWGSTGGLDPNTKYVVVLNRLTRTPIENTLLS